MAGMGQILSIVENVKEIEDQHMGSKTEVTQNSRRD